jgi:serine O-acetyltransferase
MRAFVDFLLKKVRASGHIAISARLISDALEETVRDTQFHYPDFSRADVVRRIKKNDGELAVFLFRLASRVHRDVSSIGLKERRMNALAWLMKECCGCEIYASNIIGEGFYVTHSVGVVIGSRNKIGKGFQIYQGATIGHRYDYEDGCVIGDGVSLYPNAAVIGPVNIGNDCVIGRNCMVTCDLPARTVCHEAPRMQFKKNHRSAEERRFGEKKPRVKN